jgi:hypothetical protein
MLDELREDDTNGDFHNKWGFRVAVVSGLTSVACHLASAVITSVKKMIVLLTRAVDVLGAAEVVLAALATARDRLPATYMGRVKLAHAKFGSTMLARNQSKTNMTRQLPLSVTILVSTTSQKVASMFALSSTVSVNRYSGS